MFGWGLRLLNIRKLHIAKCCTRPWALIFCWWTNEPLFRKHISFELLKNCKCMHHYVLIAFRHEWSKHIIYVLMIRVIKLIVLIIETYHCYQPGTKFYPTLFDSRLTPCMNKIIGNYQCIFQHNRLSTGQIFCIRQISKNKLEYNDTSVTRIYGHQGYTWFILKRSIVKCSHLISNKHKPS